MHLGPLQAHPQVSILSLPRIASKGAHQLEAGIALNLSTQQWYLLLLEMEVFRWGKFIKKNGGFHLSPTFDEPFGERILETKIQAFMNLWSPLIFIET